VLPAKRGESDRSDADEKCGPRPSRDRKLRAERGTAAQLTERIRLDLLKIVNVAKRASKEY
jgi:hypothetical protein